MTSSRLVYITENSYDLRPADRIVGYYLYDNNEEAIARIQGILAEQGTLLARYLVIDIGGFLKIQGKRLLVPLEICEAVDMGKVKTEWKKESLQDAPTADDVENVSMNEEELILSYFDLEPYWAARPHRKKNEPRPEDG